MSRFPRPALAALFAAALLLGGAGIAAAQDAASDDAMFGVGETITPAAGSSNEAAGKSEFLKYDQTKVGGSITGKLGFASAWAPAWDGSAKLLDPTSYSIAPDVEGQVTLVAKPLTDFGVNMDFRTSWPFTSTLTTGTGAATKSYTIPNISVWSLYSKFNWQDKVYFSFGKQPISWGVSKGYFQPADDIFAVTMAIDPTNTGKEREGPISLKTTLPLGVTNNLYFFAGLPTDTGGATTVDPADVRLAAKVEYGFGNTELALGGFYAYNDHPRGLLMLTTGLGSWNVFGEGVLKYGSERYFLTKSAAAVVPVVNPSGIVGAQESGKFYFAGTLGGYYTNSDNNVSLSLAYMYNGEAQSGVTAAEAYGYLALHSTEIDRAKFGAHYAFASISKGDILPSLLGSDKLTASLIAIANLADQSGYVMPSLTWSFFDYMSLQLGGTFNFGAAGSEYITYGVGTRSGMSLPDKPGAALNLTLTVGTGAF